MPCYYEIEAAFRSVIQMAPNGRRTVTTEDFIRQLKAVNWQWTLKEANDWIESRVSTFRYVSTEEGEKRTFMLFNPNGGL